MNIQGLEGGAPAHIISKIWREKNRPLLVVTAAPNEAEAMGDDISYLAAGAAPGPIKIFPAPSSLPYTRLISQADTWIERLSVLYTAENEKAPLVIAPVAALLRKVPPRKLFLKHIEHIAVGQKIEKEAFIRRLVLCGYNNSPLVEEEGDFASRGCIIDVWSPAGERPVRIELEGMEVVSIRSFDPETQRTSFIIDRVIIVPVRSVILYEETVKDGLVCLKRRSEEIGLSAAERRAYAESVRSGIYPAYTETLLPIFHPDASTLLDYLGIESVIVEVEPPAVREAYSNFWGEMEDAYREAVHIEKAVRPDELYITYDGWQESLRGREYIRINDVEFSRNAVDGVSANHLSNGHHPISLGTGREGLLHYERDWFISKIKSWHDDGMRIVMVCHTPTQSDRLVDLLRWQGIAPTPTDLPFTEIVDAFSSGIFVTVGSITRGFILPDEKLVLLTENEMFGKRRKRVPAVRRYQTEAFTSYHDLSDGDFLVHVKHGVGRYCGMEQMEFDGKRNDFVKLEYLGGDKLYVPVYNLGLIQKYVGPGDGTPFLDRLGGKRWERARLKADRAVRRLAAELIRLYAERKVRQGFAFSERDQVMEEFEASFPYDETPDQIQAIEDVLRDMSRSTPADRLICGDVGYGKTEVAIRAAFRAAMDGKQVAVLVPTTILALQHFETFKQRFKNTPINIELLNRFISKKEQLGIVSRLLKGEVDIVIGTHRLLQTDIKFRDLGLLIIDEEHRFGVRQKERIKKLKTAVDVISMSATPIPRTLHISLIGARDISIINTPPADRLSIRTYVAEFDEGLIRSAILKEIRRGGQVFFVHNRVETIESMKERLSRLIPEVKITVAHGQMREGELEKVMVHFLKKEFDVLLTTTIIESGLDIPSVNTLIVNRADTFGLAQLYQIRGRVGRSNIQAYAYFLIPDQASITAIQAKRLAALQKYTELGSGFQIAMHDLEIRGAGNLLGAEQSGHISAIGYELYTELLEREVRRLKGEREVEKMDTEINIPVEAFIPADYIEDDGTRMVFYKRISAVAGEEDIDGIAKELRDRFGKLPEPVKNLLKVVEIKAAAGRIGIESIQVSGKAASYKFSPEANIEGRKLLDYVQKNQSRMRIRPDATIVISIDTKSERDIFFTLRSHMGEFSNMIASFPSV